MTRAVASRLEKPFPPPAPIAKPVKHLVIDEVAQSLWTGLGGTCYSKIASQDMTAVVPHLGV